MTYTRQTLETFYKEQKENKKMDREIFIKYTNGTEEKITIPSGWVLTFGPIAIGQRISSNDGRSYMPLGLRLYADAGKSDLRATFTSVEYFRDMTISVKRKRVRTEDKIGHMEVDGARKVVSMNVKVADWIDPNDLDAANEGPKLIGLDADDSISELREEPSFTIPKGSTKSAKRRR